MAASHTPKNDESILVSCSKHILHDYYEKNDITLLIAVMAQDITWTGAGSTMIASGRDAVTRFFYTAKDKMIHTILSHEQWISHELTPDLWLIIGAAEVESVPELRLFLKEHMKCDFLYRRNPDAASGTGWELVHLNNSISYNKLQDKETFAVSEGIKNLQLRSRYSAGTIDESDKAELFRTINEKVFRYLDQDTREALIALSLFNRSTVKKALFMCPNVNISTILSQQEKIGLFLYLDRQTQKYTFYPLMREFLQSEFKLLDEKIQLQHMDMAAHWYYSMGSLPEAMRFAVMAKDYDLSLSILNKGVDAILLSGFRTYPADLLEHIPDEIMKKHMKTVILMVYDLHFSERKAEYRRSLSRIKQLGLDPVGKIALHFLEGTTSFNHLDKMITSCSKVLDSIRKLHAEQEFHAPRLGFCCPSFTMMYHSSPGKLKEELIKLIALQNIMNEINGIHDNSAWEYYFKGEYYFYTGRFDEASMYLSYLEATEGYREDLSLQIRCHHFRGYLSYLLGNKQGLYEARKKVRKLILTSEPYQALIARLSDEGFYMLFPGSREETDDAFRITSSMYYFPAHTYLEIMQDEALIRPGNGLSLLSSAIRHERLARQRHSVLGEIYALLHQAIAHDMLRENEKCLDCLQKALTLAALDHLIVPFLTVSGHFAGSWNRLKTMKTTPDLLKEILAFKDKTAAPAILRETELQKKIKNLTGREMEIIRLVMAGNKNKEIAVEMKVAEITIKKALSLIYKKLGVQNRAQLVAMFKEK